MPISQYALQSIANPMSGGIGSISTALSQIKQSKHEEALNAIRTQELDMKIEAHDQSTKLNQLKMQEQLGKTALMSAQYQDAYADSYVKAIRSDPEIMKDPLKRLELQRKLAEGKPLPEYLSEDLLDPKQIMQMQMSARDTIEQFASQEKREMWQERDRLARLIQSGEATGGDVAAFEAMTRSDGDKQWQERDRLARLIASGNASEGDKAAFEAMRPAPLVQVNQPGPGGQGWAASYDIFQSMTDPDGEDLKGNVKNEAALITMIDSRAKLLVEQSQEAARKAKDPSLAISYDTAAIKAKGDIFAEGKVKKTEGWLSRNLGDVGDWIEDLVSEKWEFDAEGKPEGADMEPAMKGELPEGLSEADIEANMKKGWTREEIIEAYKMQSK